SQDRIAGPFSTKNPCGAGYVGHLIYNPHTSFAFCQTGRYKPGGKFAIKGFYIEPKGDTAKICIHALTGMISLLSPFIHGVSAKTLGIGSSDNEGYIQCPDPGKPYTCGGTVIFKAKRIKKLT
ncbi:MAG: hypothetical protein B6U76_03535, partial [Desulfurococcales archaeon ex4484_217_2]